MRVLPTLRSDAFFQQICTCLDEPQFGLQRKLVFNAHEARGELCRLSNPENLFPPFELLEKGFSEKACYPICNSSCLLILRPRMSANGLKSA